MDDSCKVHEGDVAVGGKASTTDDQETAYGPWLVMTHKRFGNRPTMKVGPTKELNLILATSGVGRPLLACHPPRVTMLLFRDGLRSSKRKAALGQDDLGFNRCTSPTFMTSGLNEPIGGCQTY